MADYVMFTGLHIIAVDDCIESHFPEYLSLNGS